MRELRDAARLLARAPGFTLMVSVLLALGIGMAMIAYSLFDAVLLRPLHASHPEELVRIVQRLPKVGAISSFPETYYQSLRDRATTLTATFGEAGEYDRFTITAPLPAEDISVRGVTATFFSAVGAPPLLGRALEPRVEGRMAGTPPAVLSYRFWRRRFDGDSKAIGRTFAVNGRYFAVLGVMPDGFNGLTTDTGPDLWIPLNAFRTLLPSDADAIALALAGRLKPGASRVSAEAECRTIWHSTMNDFYRNVEHRSEDETARLVARTPELESLTRGVSALRDSFGDLFKVSIAAALLLLLIVCSNVGGLLVARSVAHQHESAVRLALGASPLTLLRQVLAEGVLLAALGGIGGVIVAAALLPFARGVLPPIRDRAGSLLPLTLTVAIDARGLLFVVVVAVLATVCFSVSPAVVVYRTRLDAVLRSARSMSGGRAGEAPIIVQVALCAFFLLMANVFVRTLQQLRDVDTGIDIDRIATFTGNLGAHAGAGAPAFLAALNERVRNIPGVRSAAVSSVGVMRGRGILWTIAPTGSRITKAHFLDAGGNTVSPDYFETMGMHIVEGQGFANHGGGIDARSGSIQTVVNQAFAAKFFPDADPIGKYFGTPVDGIAGGQYKIVGMVNDAKYRSVREPIVPMFSALGTPSDSFVLNVRANARPDAIIEPVRTALRSLDPALPFREVHTMREEVENSMAAERLTAVLASSVGLCAVLFAGAGVYASVGYAAARRRREVAIRMALGAGRMRTAALIARRTLTMVGAGIIAGVAAGATAASFIRSMLFNASPQDPESIASAILFVIVMAAVAAAVPAIRATRTEPAEALRCE